jgi:hypothetical protein
MSVVGTGIAASIAQTSLQAQQVARQRDQRDRQISGDTRRINELIEARMLALEEGDRGDTANAPRVNDQLPQHRHEPQAGVAAPRPHTGEAGVPQQSRLDVQA